MKKSPHLPSVFSEGAFLKQCMLPCDWKWGPTGLSKVVVAGLVGWGWGGQTADPVTSISAQITIVGRRGDLKTPLCVWVVKGLILK